MGACLRHVRRDGARLAVAALTSLVVAFFVSPAVLLQGGALPAVSIARVHSDGPGGGSTAIAAAADASWRRFSPAPLRRSPVAARPPPPRADDGVSHLDCVGGDPTRRSCWARNVCWNVSVVAWPRHKLSFYAPAGAGQTLETGERAPDGSPRVVKDNAAMWLRAGTLETSFSWLRATVHDGPIPDAQVAAWVDEPTLLLNRHYPDNFAHALCDDWFPLFHMLREWLGWDTAEAAAWTGAGLPPLGTRPTAAAAVVAAGGNATAASAAAAGRRTVGLLHDDFGGLVATRFFPTFAAVFPNVHTYDAADFAADYGTSAERPLLCFRAVGMGVPGYTMMRNGGYSWAYARRNPVDNIDAPLFLREHLDFRDHLEAMLGAGAAAPPLPAPAPGRGDVVFLARAPDAKGARKRAVANEAELLEWLQKPEVCGGRAVVRHVLGSAGVAADIALLRRADLVLAVHGAGTVNLMFLRPGAAWVDLIPPRVPNLQPVMVALALRYGVRVYTQPIIDEAVPLGEPPRSALDAANYTVDAPAVAGIASVALGNEP